MVYSFKILLPPAPVYTYDYAEYQENAETGEAIVQLMRRDREQ